MNHSRVGIAQVLESHLCGHSGVGINNYHCHIAGASAIATLTQHCNTECWNGKIATLMLQCQHCNVNIATLPLLHCHCHNGSAVLAVTMLQSLWCFSGNNAIATLQCGQFHFIVAMLQWPCCIATWQRLHCHWLQHCNGNATLRHCSGSATSQCRWQCSRCHCNIAIVVTFQCATSFSTDSVELAWNDVGDQGGALLASHCSRFDETNNKRSALKHLGLGNDSIGFVGANAIIESLKNNHCALQSLALRENCSIIVDDNDNKGTTCTGNEMHLCCPQMSL